MNSLSWLIYLAQVLPAIKDVLVGLGVGLIIYLTIWIIVYAAGVAEGNSKISKPKIKWVFISVTLILVSVFIPSKETIYLIAGSEAGEAVVTSEGGKEVLNDVKEIINIQLQKLKE